MPSVCLVTALTVADFIDPDLIVDAHANTGAQVGVLTLAAILRQRGRAPDVLNLDDLFFEFIGREQRRRRSSSERVASASRLTVDDATHSKLFFPFVVAHLRPMDYDVFGLSSICSSYPLTLRIADEIKRQNPGATIVLGGPQASVVDVATLKAFPSVDIVVRGEADDSFPDLLQCLDETGSWRRLDGITFRLGGEVTRNPNAPVVDNLDRLPLPAFDLDSRLKTRGGVHLEMGRGCPFACTFCSTNDFFRRNFRLKSPDRMVADMRTLSDAYGLTYFSLVHDMYTIDRKKVVAFCERMRAAGANLTWGCSARTDCVDDELLRLMAQAGCTGIFFGIETGSQRLQQTINKKLDLTEARARIAAADRNGMKTTVALIVGFPEETREDLRDTIHFFVESLRFDHAEPQISLLAPLAATPIYEQHKHHLTFDAIYSDMSHQSWQQDPADDSLIRAHPEVFPNFYAIPTVLLERRYVKNVMDFVTYLAMWFRWLPVALLQDSGDMLTVFDRWQQWRTDHRGADADEPIGWTPYYSHRRFHEELIEFVQTCYVPEMAQAATAVSAVARAEQATVRRTGRPIADDTDVLTGSTVPYVPETLCVAGVAVDYKALIEALRQGSDLRDVDRRDTTIVFAAGQDTLDVWQLPPLSAALLHLCDGARTVTDILRDFSGFNAKVDDVPADSVCVFGLLRLKADGFIRLSASPIVWEAHDASADEAVARSADYMLPLQAGNTQQPWPAP